MSDPTPPTARLREAPTMRFGGPQHAFDLLQLSAHLLNEAHCGTNGHRQMTIFKGDATTIVLFAFEAGGTLSDHKAKGLVTIHALDGSLTISAEEQTHALSAGQLLVLDAGVMHNVTAREVSRMLLTVHMEKAAAR